MADLGLGTAYAAGSLQALLRQRMQDQIDAQDRARKAMEADREFGLRQQEFQSTQDVKKLLMGQQQAEHAANLQRQIQGERDTAAARATGPMAMGDTIPSAPYDRTFAGTASESAFTPQLSLPATQISGTGEPGSATATAAPQQPTGRMTYGGSATQRKEAEDQAKIDAIIADPNTPGPFKGFLKARGALPKGENIPYQLLEPNAGKAGAVHDTAAGLQTVMNGVATPITDASGKPVQGYHAPGASVFIQHGEDEQGNPVDRVVPKTPGATYAGRQNATTANRVTSAKTLITGGERMMQQLTDPQLAAKLGPVMGRYNSLRDFIGNPPPEFANLAGEIESFALANVGVHGMRSAIASERIKSLLDERHTPESLAAGIDGLLNFSRDLVSGTKGGGKGATAPKSKYQVTVEP